MRASIAELIFKTELNITVDESEMDSDGDATFTYFQHYHNNKLYELNIHHDDMSYEISIFDI